MPRNGSGTYTLPQPAFVAGTKIQSAAMNSDLSDIATALTQSVSADGQTPLTGALKFASGTAAAPGVSFNSDTTTGLYLPSAGNIGLAAGGTSVGTSSASAITWNLNTTISGSLSCITTLAVTGNSTFTGTINDPRGQYTGVLLNTLTASTSATLNDTTSLTASYSSYEIVFNALLPVTNSTALLFRIHSGGSFQATTYNTNWVAAGGSTVTTNNTTTTFIPLTIPTAPDVSNASNEGVCGRLKIFNPSQTSAVKAVLGEAHYTNSSSVPAWISFGGYWNGGAGAVDGLQFLFNSGNIASGTVKIYGFV